MVLALGVASCATAPPPVPAKVVPVAADDEWARASWDDRHDTMEFVVHPNMARLFQAHAKQPDPDMTCRTCHGADAEAVNYAMPHGLPALDPAHMPNDETAKFMAEEVTPKMIELLGTTPQHFGCFNCHPRQK